jgi:hypothetical protein
MIKDFFGRLFVWYDDSMKVGNEYSSVYKRVAVALIFSPAIYLFFLLLTSATSQDGIIVAYTILLPLSLISILFVGLSVIKYKSLSQTQRKAKVSTKRIVGNIIYAIGSLILILSGEAFLLSAGMVVLSGLVIVLPPIVGAILVVIGKVMIDKTKIAS